MSIMWGFIFPWKKKQIWTEFRKISQTFKHEKIKKKVSHEYSNLRPLDKYSHALPQSQEVFSCLYKTDPSYYSSQVIKKYIAKVIKSFRLQLS